jgi:uncharacterized membrane protein YidH (DUF202 family)
MLSCINCELRIKTEKMKKTIASIFTIGGLIALIYTAINYMNNSESFGFMGADVVVSKGDPIPVIISAFVMIIGIILLLTKDK